MAGAVRTGASTEAQTFVDVPADAVRGPLAGDFVAVLAVAAVLVADFAAGFAVAVLAVAVLVADFVVGFAVAVLAAGFVVGLAVAVLAAGLADGVGGFVARVRDVPVASPVRRRRVRSATLAVAASRSARRVPDAGLAAVEPAARAEVRVEDVLADEAREAVSRRRVPPDVSPSVRRAVSSARSARSVRCAVLAVFDRAGAVMSPHLPAS